MLTRLTALLRPRDPRRIAPTPGFAQRLEVLDKDPYLAMADWPLRLISVFDDLRYDRSDLDLMSGPMRRRVIDRVAPLGFRQVTGSVIEHPTEDIRLLLPKFRALGASPFDATRDTPRRTQDFYVLTPVQTACQIVTHYEHGEAVERIKALVQRHPINLFRLVDYLEHSPRHHAFLRAIGHLRYVQRIAVESDPLRRRRALT